MPRVISSLFKNIRIPMMHTQVGRVSQALGFGKLTSNITSAKLLISHHHINPESTIESVLITAPKRINQTRSSFDFQRKMRFGYTVFHSVSAFPLTLHTRRFSTSLPESVDFIDKLKDGVIEKVLIPPIIVALLLVRKKIFQLWRTCNEDGKAALIIFLMMVAIWYYIYKKDREENERLQKLLKINNIPSLPAYYVKREDHLKKMSMALEKENIVIIHGMTGQGKTTLALAYIKKYHKNYLSKNPICYRIDAQSEMSLWCSLEILAKELDATFEANLKDKKEEIDRHQFIENTIQKKLEEYKCCVIVLDNAGTNNQDLSRVINLFQQLPLGKIIITTQNPHLLPGNISDIDLKHGLSINEAEELFKIIFKNSELLGKIIGDTTQLQEFIYRLQDNTLSIKQAFLYLEHVNVDRIDAGMPLFTGTDYLKLLKTEFEQLEPELRSQISVEHQTLYAAIQLSIENALTAAGSSQFKLLLFLGFCSLLHHSDIPREFLNHFAAQLNQPISPGADAVTYFIRQLHNFSLLDYQQTSGVSDLKVHEAVQKVSLSLLKKKLMQCKIKQSKTKVVIFSAEGDEIEIPLPKNYATEDFALLSYLNWIADCTKNYLERMLIEESVYERIITMLKHTECLLQHEKNVLAGNMTLNYFNLIIIMIKAYNQVASHAPAKLLGQEALEKATIILGEHDSIFIELLNNMGFAFLNSNNQESLRVAKVYYEHALTIQKKKMGEDHPDVAKSLHNLAAVHFELGGQANLEQAKVYYEQALDIRKKKLGEDHLDVAKSLNNLAGVHSILGDQANLEQAKVYYEHALTIQKKKLGEDHPDVAGSLNNLAVVLSNWGDLASLEQAKAYHELALNIQKKKLGEDHPDVAKSLHNLARVHSELGGQENLEQAKAYHEQALDIQKKKWGENHLNMVMSLNDLAWVYYCLGGRANLEQAKVGLEQALSIWNKNRVEDHLDWVLAVSLSNLAYVYSELGGQENLEQAKTYHEQALAIRKKKLGGDHLNVAKSLNGLATVHFYLGGKANLEQAKTYHEQALNIKKEKLGEDHPDVAASLNNLAETYCHLGGQENLRKARMYYEQALSIWKKKLGEDHPHTVTSLHNLAEMYCRLGGKENLQQAKNYDEQVLSIWKKKLGEYHHNVAESLNNLACVYYKLGGRENLQTAKHYHEQALVIVRAKLGEQHPRTLLFQNNLKQCLTELDAEDEKSEPRCSIQ